MLQEMGLPAGMSPDVWNVERPDAVRALYRAYLDAGSQIILSNSFSGNRVKLKRAGGPVERAAEMSRAAVALAVEEAAGHAYVAADMGPTGELLAPYGTLSYEEARDAYAEQAAAFAEGGADLIWIETMADLNECKAAVAGATEATDLPVFCSLSFNRGGRTMMGASGADAVEALWPMGLTAIGANCGEGIEPVVTALSAMRETLQAIAGDGHYALIAKPNAGLPRLEGERTVYDLGPDEMAAQVHQFVELGAQVIGGCCGSTPAHIARMAEALRA